MCLSLLTDAIYSYLDVLQNLRNFLKIPFAELILTTSMIFMTVFLFLRAHTIFAVFANLPSKIIVMQLNLSLFSLLVTQQNFI